jgi:lysophospholipase L1-like esterase
VAVLALAFAWTRRQRHGTHGSTSVAVVGDSITVLVRDDLQRELSPRYRTDVQAQNGMRIDEMLVPLQEALQAKPRDAVVNLGTNDALQGGSHPGWHSGFSSMIRDLEPVQCAVLVNISTALPNGPQTNKVAADINAAIGREVAEHPNMHMLDWDAQVRGAGGAALIDDDRIHPSAKGQVALATGVRHALDTECRG